MLSDKSQESVGTPHSILPEEDIEVLFNRIKDSDTFRTAPMMRTLLVYLWQHRNAPTSEYAVAVDGLGRRADFDPKTDATVRVEISRARRKLKEFYEVEGKLFSLRLSIPLGGHQLLYDYTSSAHPAGPDLPRLRRSPWTISFGLACLSMALCLLCMFLLVQNRRLRASTPAPNPLPSFWQSFFDGGKPTSIVVASPVYFVWRDHGLIFRDLRVSDFSGWSTSPMLRELAEKWGAPELDPGLVVARDALAAGRLLQYFDNHGKRVRLIGSADLPENFLAEQNVVYLGGPRTTGRFEESLTKMNFFITVPNPTIIRNRNPAPGEPVEYSGLVESGHRQISPGIITLLPRTPEGSHCLVLVGQFSTALASLLLSIDGSKLLAERWSDAGRPDAWQMVVQAEIDGETVLKAWPVAFRGVKASF